MNVHAIPDADKSVDGSGPSMSASAAEKPVDDSAAKSNEDAASLVKPPQMTKAEMAFQKRQAELMSQRAMIKAQKSHREKVEDFNKKMNEMTEFNDIPKVSWTK